MKKITLSVLILLALMQATRVDAATKRSSDQTVAVQDAGQADGKGIAPIGEARVYKTADGRELKLYVVMPADWKATDTRPALVFFHGGGWVGGKPGAFNFQASYFATRGIVCFLVEYRLVKRDESPENCVNDAKSAMRWVRSHAGELGVDPHRIGASGGSAGGHLAAFAGMVDRLDDPQDDLAVSPKADAMVLFNPVFDNGDQGGYGHDRVGDRVKEFSPAHNITSDDPSAIVLLGRQDRFIPVSTVERFQSGMKVAGVRCDVVFYDHCGHGFFNREPYRSLTLIEADKFLASLGWLTGSPTLNTPTEDVSTENESPANKNKNLKLQLPGTANG